MDATWHNHVDNIAARPLCPYNQHDYQKVECIQKTRNATWKMIDKQTGHPKVLKRIDIRTSLRREQGIPLEYLIATYLAHPNISNFETLCVTREFFYMVGNWHDGIPLSYIDYTLDVRRISGWMTQIVSALGYCHSKGIVHSDVKPSNIIAMPDGTVYLMDFEYSYFQDLPEAEKGMLGGTPLYCSAERFDRCAYDGYKADVWALGVTMYELYFDEMPFSGATPKDLWKAVCYTEPIYDVAADIVDSNVERYLALVRKMLSKSPDDRPALDCEEYQCLAEMSA